MTHVYIYIYHGSGWETCPNSDALKLVLLISMCFLFSNDTRALIKLVAARLGKNRLVKAQFPGREPFCINSEGV